MAPSIAIALSILGMVAFGGCSITGTSENAVAEPSGPQFAILCIPSSKWPHLLRKMSQFAATHRLELHGGIDATAHDGSPQLNAYVADGYSYIFGDDFDLWFVSDPFRPSVVYLNGVLKNKPITREQTALAKELLSEIRDISSAANGESSDPHCSV